MAIDIVNLPINNIVIFHSFFFIYVYQRVTKSLWDNDGIMMRYNSLDGENYMWPQKVYNMLSHTIYIYISWFSETKAYGSSFIPSIIYKIVPI